ncbi:hypothetical protein PHLGIDRAFT_397575 [Phlebiopsis gigantea 11061_1 CR5-6]|uniref:Uncharacterized protein n=1 Tax=Phlebiopsis gigantea (strain 11061_1 CR5-6) TaxID=745531 RepID=A0A0C3P286_PHLG1|nr:hypothetical protein PHLGIDRAFT_397575 [Phlebiopsis gigantea 11061_1 CR5-6]
MTDFKLSSLSATGLRAGPSKRKSILSNGIIYEVEQVHYGPELFVCLEEAEPARVQSAQKEVTFLSGGWRESRPSWAFDDDIWDSTSSPAQSLAAYMTNSCMTAPILLIPPSRKQPEWTVTPAYSADAQLHSKQIFLATSSISIAEALDELCSMTARMSVQNDNVYRAPRSTSPQLLDDVCRLLGTVSISKVPDVKQGAIPASLADFSERSSSTCTDDDASFYDSSSDATYVEEDSVSSVCGEHVEEAEPMKKKVTTHDTFVEAAHFLSEKWTLETSSLAVAMEDFALMTVDAATVIASIGFRYADLPYPRLHPCSRLLFAPPFRYESPKAHSCATNIRVPSSSHLRSVPCSHHRNHVVPVHSCSQNILVTPLCNTCSVTLSAPYEDVNEMK